MVEKWTVDQVNPEAVGISSLRLERVRKWLDSQVSSGRVPGVSALIARRGRVAFFEASGIADVDSSRPFTQDTIVRIFSMTKPITSVAAMMLYEEGLFQLDDPVGLYLPEFTKTRVWAGGDAVLSQTIPTERPMTVRHLLTHTSGLTKGSGVDPTGFMQDNPVAEEYRARGINFHGKHGTLSEVISRLPGIPLLCQPGTAWNYGVSTDVLGHLIEIWSGLSLEEFFRVRIFEPLGMNDTDFHVEPSKHDRFAACYRPLEDIRVSQDGTKDESAANPTGYRLFDGINDSRFIRPAGTFSGGAGLVGSMPDYARFCQMLLNRGQLDGKRLLSRPTVEYMCTNHLPQNRDLPAMNQEAWNSTSYAGIGFGLGFAVVVNPVKAHLIASLGECHWGGSASTMFWIDPKEDLFAIFFTQLRPSNTHPFRRDFRVQVNQALID